MRGGWGRGRGGNQGGGGGPPRLVKPGGFNLPLRQIVNVSGGAAARRLVEPYGLVTVDELAKDGDQTGTTFI